MWRFIVVLAAGVYSSFSAYFHPFTDFAGVRQSATNKYRL
jgi:hypothetical protein